MSRLYKERYGLSVPEWRVLAHLGQYAPITAKAIGAHSRMHKTKVSRAVAELAARGFLARSGNPEDGREDLLALTAKGRAAYADLAPRAAGFAKALMAGFSASEVRSFDAVVERLLKKLEAGSSIGH